MTTINKDYLSIIKQSLRGLLDTKCDPDWQFFFQSNDDFKRLMTNGNIRTLLSSKRLDNIEFAIQHICDHQVKGDVFEAGCWRGGALLYAKACLNVYDKECQRTIYGADLFPQSKSYVSNRFQLLTLKILMRCLPIFPQTLQKKLVNTILEAFPNEEYSETTKSKIRYFCRQLSYIPQKDLNPTSYDDVIEAFKRYHLYDQRVKLVQGWFDQTFPDLEKQIKELALLRVDADFYQSTLHALTAFYPKLSEGSICIIDDYGGFDDCKRAVDEYRSQHNITSTMHSVDGICYYWFQSNDGKEYVLNQPR